MSQENVEIVPTRWESLKTRRIPLKLAPAEYEVICTIPGHAQQA
jgi:hypothetical protein